MKTVPVLAALALWTVLASADTAPYRDGMPPLTPFQDCAHCPEMVVMPLGSFMMGAIEGESRNPFDVYGLNPTFQRRGPDEINIIPSEHPRHPVEVDIPFAIAKNETTHAEWMACVEAGGCSHNPDHFVTTRNGIVYLGPDHPAINVSYLDALDYIAWLNAQVGADVYRLPTEAEWEYAARAGTETPFAQGDDLSPDQANFSGWGTENIRGYPMPHLPNRRQPVTVHELDAANPWGLRHMSGNLLELTIACWAEAHIGLSSTSEYLAHYGEVETCRRVVKGGAWAAAIDRARLATRGSSAETHRAETLGFRAIRELPRP